MPNSSYNQLTESQKKAVFHINGPLLILAGPGSGKTRVITYRIAALIKSGIKPANILAITFTNKAADEMRQRAAALGASAGAHISTFHSLCVRILRRYAEPAAIKPNFGIYDTADQTKCVKQAVKECELDSTNFSPVRILDAISALKNKLLDVNSLKAIADDFFSKKLADIYGRYQNILTEQNSLDFDDLLMKTALLLQKHPEICFELADRFKFLLIDEYQDTNHAQYKIAKAVASSHRNICVTGDPDQSIYHWRGADISNILAFEKDWPDAAVVRLEENFRSTPNILSVADNLIAANKKRKLKKLIPTRPAGGEVSVNASNDEQHEADGVAEQIRKLAEQKACFGNIAVFYRVNSMSRPLEEAFIKNKIPYQIVRGVEFYSRKEVRDMLAYLKVLVNPEDEISLLRIINTPARGIGKTTIDRVCSFADKNNITVFEALKTAEKIAPLSKAAKTRIAGFINMIENFKADSGGEVAPLTERIFAESGIKEALKAAGDSQNTQMENINELLNAAAQYDRQTENPSLLDYLQQIALFSDADSYHASNDRVALMTLHTAKGLEFENVFIIGAEDGLLPHEKSLDDEDQLEEERRLFFVGITRAKSGLYISYARYRTQRGQMLRTIPSQFLYELGADFTELIRENNAPLSDMQYAIHNTQYEFTAGQLVGHKKFGAGVVKKFNDTGENSTVVVQFNSGQIKTLMVKYANLLKIK